MKRLITFFTAPALLLCLATAAAAQSGRPGTVSPPPPPPPAPQDDPRPSRPDDDGPTSLCVEKKRAAERDALLAEARAEQIFSPREVDSRAVIKAKPNPRYTEEARRNGTSGTVRVRAVLSATGRVTLVSVLSGLPDGLSQNAIDAACALKFQPAVKDGRPVAQRVVLEYRFEVFDRRAPGIVPSAPRWPR